ncbi:MAG: SDR family oxidoreductase [Alphaproteobacteria bacterium]|nr:SDR family oxidoreductase [Alphaproteobacteria bacterium]
MENALKLDGKRVLITGASRGIGAMAARCVGALGGEVVLVDLLSCAALRDEFNGRGIRAQSFQADVAKRAELEQVAAACGPVAAAVACAGICPFEDWLSDSGWDEIFHQVMDVNLLGPINVARVWLPRLVAQGGGKLVMVGSIAGRMGGTSPIVQPHYVASKGGVHALVYWLAQRYAPKGVRINGVAPGPVETEMTATTPYDTARFPLGRRAKPEEIAWPIAFLCGSGADFMSGAILDVNGGLFVG